MCGIASADYVYLTKDQKFQGELNLNIDLISMIKLLPNLPEDRKELQNDEFMLNRIFATTTTRERIPAMPAPNNGTSSLDSSGDSWKAAVNMPMPAWTDGPSISHGGASSIDINSGETLPSLEERAQQEIGNVPDPDPPQLSQAQKLLQKPAYFAINVVTATTQAAKVAAIIAAILIVIGGVAYSVRHEFQVKPPTPQPHAAPPVVRQSPVYIKHSTRVYAVRKPVSAPAQGVSGAAEPGALTPDATPHRHAYQTYP